MLSSIPEFERYYLPKGEHICTIEEIENRFLFSDTRKLKWKNFKALFERMLELGLKPDILIINGSFVTERESPGDVDFAVLIPPDTVRTAIKTAVDDEDAQGVSMFMDTQNMDAIRKLFGAHLLVADNEFMLEMCSKFFRQGQNGILREPDPKKDPEWVTRPQEKGILRVEMYS